ncbi:DoxX family protein [Vulcanococcus limneticus]|uniref:DoxX family protein n=1 Tax=Vulcanococcus limneticus TaxID=2170428 RepID=UPI00398BE659
MAIPLPLEILAGICASTLTIGLLRGEAAPAPAATSAAEPWASGAAWRLPAGLRQGLRGYLLGQGRLQSVGLLLLRLAIGVMMIHHGQDKLADPQGFATNYVAALHLPFPLLMAYAAGYAEILGSWLLIFGLFTPLGALALSGTMAVAGYHHILTSGLNIYVLELVVLYLGGSVGLLLLGPGRYSFDAGIAGELLGDEPRQQEGAESTAASMGLTPSLRATPGAG